ncbi:MAG: response regulator [Pseudomonadota bacterium]|nr:response regulator [Pseudomonadota bacterium]
MDNAKIYIVEDSSIIRENLIEALHENAPVEVVGTADDEKSAIAWLRDRSHASDLVIVDIFLRSGSGLGVLKAMSDMPDAPQRIVLSNHATPEIRVKCQELGATKVFDKSNELDEMLGWLNRFAQNDRGAAASHS